MSPYAHGASDVKSDAYGQHAKEVREMAGTPGLSSPGDVAKWLALASALAGVGVLPKGWQKTISAAGAVLFFVSMIK